MDNEMLKRYKRHARVLELKFITLYSLFVAEYGTEKTYDLFKYFSIAGRLNWTLISGVFNRQELITDLSHRDKLRFRQEVIFMGMCYGENRTAVGTRYLRLSKRTMYQFTDNLLSPEVFLTQEWLEGLDYTVAVAGVEAYRLEIERFLEFVYTLSEVIGHVSVAKI